MMEYSDIEVCTRNKRYMEAANLMLKESLREWIDKSSTHEKDVITKRVARTLEQNHNWFLVLRRINYNPMKIAQEAYEKTRKDLGLDQLDPSITLGTESQDMRAGQEVDQTND